MKRKTYIDVLRIIAVFCVIFNHTGTMGFELYASYPIGSISYSVMLFCSILCKVAVPLFLMISGALLLNKDISLKEIWFIRIPRMFTVLVITSFVYYLFNIKDNLFEFSVISFFQALCSNNLVVHLWYLYAYIAFLICQPILHNLVKNLPSSIYHYVIIVYVAFSLISLIDDKLTTLEITALLDPKWLWSNIVFYPLIGYYLEHQLDLATLSSSRKNAIAVIGVITLLTAAGLTHQNYSVLGYPTQYYHSFLIIFPCSALYILSKDIFNSIEISKPVEKAIITVGACTFGVYLMHLVIPIRGEVITFLYDTLHLPPPVATFSYCTIIFLSCFAVTFVLKKLPFAKNLL